MVGAQDKAEPLAPGSVSLRIYPHNDLDAVAVVDELQRQGALAAAAGFDGVMTSEHHGGFAGYLPNPIQAAGWLLEAMPSGWAAPCPLLLPLRPAALVAEEVAWMAARFPGRVGVGVAAGSLVDDFQIMGLDKHDLTRRFADALAEVAGMLGERDPGRLAGDLAVRRCATDPVPMVSAVMSSAAVRRAAACGVGLLFDSLSSAERARQLVDVFRAAGGAGPAVLIRRVWVGPVPEAEVTRQVDVYRGYAAPAAQAHWDGNPLITGSTADEVAGQVAAAVTDAGADAVNLRVHAPGITPEAVGDQIGALADVVSALRRLSPTG